MNGTGPGTINLTGDQRHIYFEGNQTFDNATINLGSASGYADSSTTMTPTATARC